MALAEGVTLIKPNLVELSDLVGAPLDTDNARIAACRRLAIEGRAEVVALTLGDQGALLVTADKAFRSQPLAIEPVSTVGARRQLSWWTGSGARLRSLATRGFSCRGGSRIGRRALTGHRAVQ